MKLGSDLALRLGACALSLCLLAGCTTYQGIAPVEGKPGYYYVVYTKNMFFFSKSRIAMYVADEGGSLLFARECGPHR